MRRKPVCLVKRFAIQSFQCLIILLSLSFPVMAETMVIIVHPQNSIDSITPKDIQRIYLGKSKAFSNGSEAIPLDLDVSNVVRKHFTKNIIKKSDRQLKSYWGRRIFTGKGAPPKEILDEDVLVEAVSKNLNTIGYANKSAVDSSVKIIYEF